MPIIALAFVGAPAVTFLEKSTVVGGPLPIPDLSIFFKDSEVWLENLGDLSLLKMPPELVEPPIMVAFGLR